jgi:eukaryotic-like serine/threonine-protein kinase
MNYDQQDQLTSAVPHPQQEIPPRLLSRRPVLAGLVGFAGLAALGGGFAFWRYQQPQTPVYRSRVQDEVIETVAWSPDGKRIATGGYTKDVFSESGVIHIWDALKGEHMVRSTDSAAEIFSLAWSPTSQFLASANHGVNVVRVLSPTTGAALFTYPQEKGADFDQRAVVWSPDGKRIASAGIALGPNPYSLQSWDAITGSQALTYERSFPALNLWAVAWSPDGTYLAAVGIALSQGYGVLQVWNALTGKSAYLSPPLGNNDALLESCSWAPDSLRVVIALNRTAQVWDIPQRRLLYTYHGHSDVVTTVAWSPDGTRIASGSTDKSVQIWKAETGEQTFFSSGQSDIIRSVAWSPDSRYIVSGSSDGTVQVWLP